MGDMADTRDTVQPAAGLSLTPDGLAQWSTVDGLAPPLDGLAMPPASVGVLPRTMLHGAHDDGGRQDSDLEVEAGSDGDRGDLGDTEPSTPYTDMDTVD